ncbi:hypothetical protein HAZT_HAZT009249 [Hyalella azteca]|uniref:DNA polymerase n=1 Tax=Hyalella azteca TaxID=294128 RepID=A0A6A0HBN5_HYAAZ|nr:hypothetical protein HAZT_HAZT009249 [Hyalella azteca]
MSSSGSSPRKFPHTEGNLNSDLISFLMELAEYENIVGRNVFKSNAYKTAASVLASHPKRIASGEEAAKLKGIGKKIALKIDEFLATGKLEKLEKIRGDETSTALKELARVSGVGPTKARQLYDEGITTIEQLRGNPEKLTHHQRIGLKYLEEFEQSIPRAEIEALEGALRRSLSALPEPITLTICGSYRRGKETSGDIDVLLCVKSSLDGNATSTEDPKTAKEKHGKKFEDKNLLSRIVNLLEQDKIVTDTLSLGDTKFMGVCRLSDDTPHRRLDIRLLSPDQFHCGVLYFTGSGLFNKKSSILFPQEMRSVALSAGFTLNEYSIRPVGSTGVAGEPLPVTCERDIFDYIGMDYKEPHERNM